MQKATYALIHGGGDVAWSWHLVAAELEARGHDVVAIDLPCDDDTAGFSDYADAVIDAIGDRRELVVVGHSLGGYTAGLVAARVPVELVVLVSAMVPAQDEPAGDWWTSTRFEEPAEWDDVALFLHDVPPALAAEALRRGRDQSGTPMREPWPLPGWPDVPTRFLLCRDDRFFPPAFMRRVVRERLRIEPDEIDGSHCVMLSRPRELAQRFDELRAAVSPV